MTEARFEAVVAGGGPAGAAAALALARGGRRVLLVDDQPPGRFRIGESLPPSGRPLLRELGVLERVANGGHLPSHGNVSAWGSAELYARDFIFDRNGHGWHLDRAAFDAGLRAAAAQAGAAVRSGVRLSADRVDDGWRVVLGGEKDGEEEVSAGWLVDATGRSSAIARRNGADRIHHDGLVAFHARFRAGAEGDQDARTLVESAPDGWWYTALVPGGERVAAWLTDGDLADRAALLTPEGFAERLGETEHVLARLLEHGYTLASRPRGADANSARLDTFVGDGWLAAGDAALSFDPLSSQGMLSALYTGMRAGEALHARLAGDADALGSYAARLESIHQAYMRNRATYYTQETRWMDRPFWRRRLADAQVEVSASE